MRARLYGDARKRLALGVEELERRELLTADLGAAQAELDAKLADLDQKQADAMQSRTLTILAADQAAQGDATAVAAYPRP